MEKRGFSQASAKNRQDDIDALNPKSESRKKSKAQNVKHVQ
jgi:hypothetical protein